jgi:hypothetical protein
MTLDTHIGALRDVLNRYVGVQQTLQDIEADVVLACRQIVEAAGADAKPQGAGGRPVRPAVLEDDGTSKKARGHFVNIPVFETGTGISVATETRTSPGGTEARKRDQGADSPSPARRGAKKTPRYTTGKKKWRVPPAKAKAPRESGPAPESTHTKAIAAIEKRLGRALSVKETTAAEVLLDGGSVKDVAATLSLSYAGAYYYAQKLGIDAPQSAKPPKRATPKAAAVAEETDDDE